MARGIDHVELVALATDGLVVQRHALRLDRDAAFPFELHRVEHLVLHLAGFQAPAQLNEPVGEGRLAVIDVRNDREITYEPHESSVVSVASAAPGTVAARGLYAKQPTQLVRVQPVPAHDGAVEEEDGDVEPVAAQQLRVGIDVDDVQGREGQGATQSLELQDHFVTQVAPLAVHDRQTGRHWDQCLAPCALSEFAMKRTVAGGTSPTAVTLCPSTMVEKAEDDPTVADSSSLTVC